MILRCTKKLLAELPYELHDEPESDSPLQSWHANCFRIDRRKCVLLTNDRTLYSLFLPGLRKDDFASFDFLVSQRLFKSLLYEGFSQDQIERVLNTLAEFHYTTTNNRSVLGSMNEQRYLLEALIYQDGGLVNCDVPELNKEINRNIFGAIDYRKPIEEMRQVLASLS